MPICQRRVSGEQELTAIENWRGEDALVARPCLEVQVRTLPQGGAAFLLALAAGRPLGEAAAAALEDNPEFDLAGNLAGLIGSASQRLTNLISVFCILSWRVFWMTMLNGSASGAMPILALTATEIALLDRLVNDKPQARRKNLSHYLTKIARLGGYLARANDPPPGNTVMWRGLSRLTDIALGAMVGAEIVGN